MPSTVGNVGEKVFIDLVNSEKELLYVNSTGWVYAICKYISDLQQGGRHCG